MQVSKILFLHDVLWRFSCNAFEIFISICSDALRTKHRRQRPEKVTFDYLPAHIVDKSFQRHLSRLALRKVTGGGLTL